MPGKGFPRRSLLGVVGKILKLDVDQASKEIGSIAPFLIPFVKMTCVYFVLDIPEEDPSPTAAFVKALPILSLAWLVCLHGVRYGNSPSNYVNYNRRILYGLLFSIVGDVLLIWQHESLYFMLGMLSFTGTQMCYILAFGFSPFGLKEFIPCLVGLIATLSIVYPCVSTGIMSIMVPVYAALVAIMGWRSLACFNLSGDIPWKKIFSAVGAFLFVISDIFIAINKFCYPVPFKRTIIMATYYGAQLCISLSVINFHLSAEPTPEYGASSSMSRHGSRSSATLSESRHGRFSVSSEGPNHHGNRPVTQSSEVARYGSKSSLSSETPHQPQSQVARHGSKSSLSSETSHHGKPMAQSEVSRQGSRSRLSSDMTSSSGGRADSNARSRSVVMVNNQAPKHQVNQTQRGGVEPSRGHSPRQRQLSPAGSSSSDVRLRQKK